VAALVTAVSEPDKSLSWEVRKQQYLEHFAANAWDAQAVAIADKIDNFASIVVCAAEHGDPWSMLKRGKEVQMERFEAFARTVAALPAHALVREFEAAFARLRAL
jgi:hypothetical protein